MPRLLSALTLAYVFACPQASHVRTSVCPPDHPGFVVSIIRRFEFQAALQRNLVVVKQADGRNALFAKGSPEVIRQLVHPESVPEDFDSRLEEYTREGFRWG